MLLDILTFALVFGCGLFTGSLVAEGRVIKARRGALHAPGSFYSSPSAVYWFAERSKETDAEWREMPLDEYAFRKSTAEMEFDGLKRR